MLPPMSSPFRGLVFALLSTSACTNLDPASAATTDYLTKLQPLLQENSLLAERVLFQAAAIYNEAVKPEQVAESWTTDIVPIAEHLAHQASFVAPPEPYATRHEQLAVIWTDRAGAYRNLGEAIRTADAEQWNAARRAADDVKLAEERWFDDLNEQLAGQGLVVDPYP